MKTFEQIFNSICDNEMETYDVEKMKILYNILEPIYFYKYTDIITVYNQIINLFWKDNFTNKEIIFINKILSYLHILVDIEYDFNDIDLQVNYYKYNTISTELYNEILSYKKKLKNNLNCELYDELWNKFLNFKNKEIIKRLNCYYVSNSKDYYIANEQIINEYIKINNLKKINRYEIDDHITLFFLLVLEKI
uniref:Uncharacterized protein n=1 Tax=viral metagenome TaxID=1070528 RepID=A0A6C0E184_9ZZZZ